MGIGPGAVSTPRDRKVDNPDQTYPDTHAQYKQCMPVPSKEVMAETFTAVRSGKPFRCTDIVREQCPQEQGCECDDHGASK